jgi:hypothetical protein
VKFVKSSENLADFLTREGLPKGDLEKFDLKSVELIDFFDELPKDTFTLAEWAQYCHDHPEFLTINRKEDKKMSFAKKQKKQEKLVKKLVMSIRQGIDNIKDIVTPLEILKERLSRAEIIKNQKKEFPEIYTACLAGDDFEFVDEHHPQKYKYKLVSDLLLIFDKFYKIMLPPSMIGLLLSFTHLLGHKGIAKMMADLESYYFETKYSITKRFVKCCYACFLSHKSSRKSKLGVYPIPSRAMEEVAVDLVENLNKVNGFSHLMITRCALTNFTLIHPLETKSAKEVSRLFLNAVLVPFDIKRVHQDNGRCFRAHDWLELMALFDVKIINTSAINPEARGFVERTVGLVKLMMKKYLATASSGTLYWDMITYAVNKVMNYTIDPTHGLKPAEMVFGSSSDGPGFLRGESMAPPHYSVQNNKIKLEKLNEELKEMVEYATEKWTQMKIATNERLNKNRIIKKWKENDVVFVLDRLQIPGNTRPLKLKFNPSPYLVVKCLYSTSLLRRISDNFMALYANDHIKKYDGADPIFATLPAEINNILLNKFQDFLAEDFTTITKFDNMSIPDGIQLYDPQEDTIKYVENEPLSEKFQDEIINEVNRIEPLQDEFHPEEPYDNDSTQIVPTKNDLPARSLIEQDLQALQENGPEAPDEEDRPDPDEDPPFKGIEEPVSSDEESIEETSGRKLRQNRPRTVRFDPTSYSKRRYKS